MCGRQEAQCRRRWPQLHPALAAIAARALRTAWEKGWRGADAEAVAFAEVQAACRLLAVAAVEETWRSATMCLQAVVAVHLAARRARLAHAFARLRRHALEQRCAPRVLQQQLLPCKQSDSSYYLRTRPGSVLLLQLQHTYCQHLHSSRQVQPGAV